MPTGQRDYWELDLEKRVCPDCGCDCAVCFEFGCTGYECCCPEPFGEQVGPSRKSGKRDISQRHA